MLHAVPLFQINPYMWRIKTLMSSIVKNVSGYVWLSLIRASIICLVLLMLLWLLSSLLLYIIIMFCSCGDPVGCLVPSPGSRLGWSLLSLWYGTCGHSVSTQASWEQKPAALEATAQKACHANPRHPWPCAPIKDFGSHTSRRLCCIRNLFQCKSSLI